MYLDRYMLLSILKPITMLLLYSTPKTITKTITITTLYCYTDIFDWRYYQKDKVMCLKYIFDNFNGSFHNKRIFSILRKNFSRSKNIVRVKSVRLEKCVPGYFVSFLSIIQFLWNKYIFHYFSINPFPLLQCIFQQSNRICTWKVPLFPLCAIP